MALITGGYPTTVWDGLTGNNWRLSRSNDVNPDFEDWDKISGEVVSMQTALGVAAAVGAAAGTGVVASETGVGPFRQTTLTFTNVSVTMTDATTNGSEGNLKVYDFPEALINVLGASTDLTIARVGTALTATAAIVAALGTAPAAADDTLTSTEADIIPSTASALTSGAGTFKGKSTTPAVFNGTGTAKDCYLNFAVPDAGSTGSDALLVNGTVKLFWVNMGDN